MFGRNNSSGSIFKRVAKAITSGVKRMFTSEVVVEQPKKEVKEPFRVRLAKLFKPKPKKAKVSKPKKASIDLEPIGRAMKRTKTSEQSYYTNPKGVGITEEQYLSVEQLIDGYNESLAEFRQKIIDMSTEHFDEVISSNMQDDIERAIERDKRRFNETLFEGLRDADPKGLIDRIDPDTDVDSYIRELLDNDYYDLEKRNIQYQENYITAVYNEYGENTDTDRLAALIRSLDNDTFMMSYYNNYLSTKLQEVYDFDKQEPYLEYLEGIFTKIKNKVKLTPSDAYRMG